MTTTAVASTRDYRVVVVSDCVDSMDGAALHGAALLCIEQALGLVLPSAQVLSMLDPA